MAYDQYNNYEAPSRAYYGQQKQRPAPPHTQAYDQQYSQGQDSGYYSQGGYDQYNEGYADDGQWNRQQPQQQQWQGYDQGYDQGHNPGYNGGYDGEYDQGRAQQSRSPPQHMGYGQGHGQQPPPRQHQQQPRQKNYGPGAPIRANAPPPDRQNMAQGHHPQQRQPPRNRPEQQRSPPPQHFQQQRSPPPQHFQQQRSPPPQHFQQQRPPPQQFGYERAESRQDDRRRHDGGFSPVESRAPPAPWNNNGGRNSPGPGGRPPPAPWTNNAGRNSPGPGARPPDVAPRVDHGGRDSPAPGQRIPGAAPWVESEGRNSPGPGRNSPAPGRNSPLEPIGGRPGARSRSERERIEAQRRGGQAPRRDSQLQLPMDNPFPTFPTKRAEAKKNAQTQQPAVEDAMAKMAVSDEGPRPGIGRTQTAQTEHQRPGTSQGTRAEFTGRPGTAQGNRADHRQPRDWDQQGHHAASSGQQRRAPEGYHAPQPQGSWPLSDDMAPPQPQFSMPARPSTATGIREEPNARGPPNDASAGMNQHHLRGPPQPRRRSTDQSFAGPGAAVAGYAGNSFTPQGNDFGQSPPRQQNHEQQRSPPKQPDPPPHQYGAAYAQQPRETMGYSGFSANPYADEIPDMPNFDAQPTSNRHEHAISMHMGGGAGAVQHTEPEPFPADLRNDYTTNDSYNGAYNDGYGQPGQQMYAQASASQPELHSQNGGYGYPNGGAQPMRGPGMPPRGRGRGRGLPPGPGGRGRGQLPGRPGVPPMSRLQTGDSQWSDPGARGQTGSPLSARSPQQAQNPDALPSHPTPVRPGHMEGAFNNKPPPVRQYNNVNSGPNANAGTPRQSVDQNRSSVSTTASTGPVTHEELQRLQSIVRTDPNDHKTALALAKRMIEAASSDLVNVHQDPKARQKAREKFVFDAHKVLKKLVQQQYADGMFYLADCHGQGLMGLAPDPKEAFSLYQAAAKLGHPASAYRTAVCCEMGADEGGGTRKDPLKAVQWYRRAASLGEPAAMYKLGMILLKGLLGQQRNVGEACNWLQRAADRADKDNPHSLHELGLLYAAPPNDSKLIRDDRYAAQLFEKAARLGYKYSQFRLGEAFEYGLLALPIDQRSSIAWYSKAAAQSEHQSELALSGWYLTGAEGILEQSDTEAYLWARKAAQAELPKALFALGYFTEVGIGCPRSLEEAKKWYGRAAALRYPKAQERLEELKRGGYKAQKSRERLSRSDRKQQDDNCTVM